MPDPINMGKPNPRWDSPNATPWFHSLPDRSPYLYYRTPEGRRLCFPEAEVRHIMLERVGEARQIILTAESGCRFSVTSMKPEVQSSLANQA